jgi:hypothetical protein
MAKLTQEDISRLEEKGITIGATVTCAVKAKSEIQIKSWDDWEVEENGNISSIEPIDDGYPCWLYISNNKFATVVKPAPSVQRKFKQGDIVLRGKHGTIPHKVTGYASDNIVTLTSCETGKPCQSHQENLRLQRVKAEPIQTEQPKPEPTIDEQIEAARAELERLEKIKEREQPIAFINDIQQLSVIGYDVFIANGLAPRGLEYKCIMFETANIELRTQQHNEYTVLTFHRK